MEMSDSWLATLIIIATTGVICILGLIYLKLMNKRFKEFYGD